MQLEDPGGAGVVDIFSRLMKLNLKVASSSGVPGGRIVYDDAPSRDLLVLIHELEHVTLLARPLGIFFTTLAIRLFDIRNAAAKKLHDVASALADDCPESALAICDALTSDISTWYRHGLCILTLTNVTLPVMEGLALYAESTLQVADLTEGPISFDLAIALEYQHVLATLGEQAHTFTQHDRDIFYVELWDKMLRRLADARARKGGYSPNSTVHEDHDSTHRLFFGPSKDAPGGETAQYFLGYLYIVRLLQAWRQTTEDSLPDNKLVYVANRLFGEVFAIYAASLFGVTHNAEPEDFSWQSFLGKLWLFFRHAPELTKAEIELLLDPLTLLTFDGEVTSLEMDRTRSNIGSVIASLVFGESGNEGKEVLDQIHPSQDLQLMSSRPVILVGYDADRATILFRLAVAPQYLVEFQTRQEALDKFITHLSDQGITLAPTNRLSPRVEPSESAITARLHTYIETWPEGFDHFDQEVDNSAGFANCVKIRRALFLSESNLGILDRDTPEDIAQSILLRHYAFDNIDVVIQQAVGPGWKDLRVLADELSVFVGLIEEDSILELLVTSWRDIGEPEPPVTAICQALHAKLLFPECSDADLMTLVSEKLGVVFDTLESGSADEKAAARVLWQFLKKSVWRPGTARDGFMEGTVETLELIRSVCRRRLGVPLVGMGSNGWEFDLRPAAGSPSPT